MSVLLNALKLVLRLLSSYPYYKLYVYKYGILWFLTPINKLLYIMHTHITVWALPCLFITSVRQWKKHFRCISGHPVWVIQHLVTRLDPVQFTWSDMRGMSTVQSGTTKPQPQFNNHGRFHAETLDVLLNSAHLNTFLAACWCRLFWLSIRNWNN